MHWYAKAYSFHQLKHNTDLQEPNARKERRKKECLIWGGIDIAWEKGKSSGRWRESSG